VTGANVVDQIYFNGPGDAPAVANFDITWTPTGPLQHLTPTSNDPTDQTYFVGNFRQASVQGSFSVQLGTVTYSGTWGGSTNNGIDWATIGTERNGIFTTH
jgi:hypothetical protein